MNSEKLKIKVCGMKFPDNRNSVGKLDIDLLGFIFYPPSKRYFGNLPESVQEELFQTKKQKVGVFVDESLENVIDFSRKFELQFIQLHGHETPEYCSKLKASGLKIIKAFRVNSDFDFEEISPYLNTVDFVLFDTKAELPGGTGKKFDWDILQKYTTEIPFLLSGGIKPEDAESINNISHQMLYGVDLNSGFEDEPGLKNLEKLNEFISQLK